MSEENKLNIQSDIKKEPSDDINISQNDFIKPEITDYTNANVTVKLETEDLHHAIDIKEEVSESQGDEQDSYLSSHSESDDSDGLPTRKRKLDDEDEDALKKHYECKLQKLNRRIEQEQVLFELQHQIHQKKMELLQLDLQHRYEILEMDEKIQENANKIKQLQNICK